jgi:VIT1/CCC1 family predicted Fe2+/Mn2+ transporter
VYERNQTTYELAEFAEESINAFIMALSVLNSIYLSTKSEGIANVNVVIFSVLGACAAWGLIDGVVQYVGIEVRRSRFRRLSKSLRSSMSLRQFTEHLQRNIDEDIVHNWGQDAVALLFENKADIAPLPAPSARRRDLTAFVSVVFVYLAVALLTIIPFLLLKSLYAAVVASNTVSTGTLFAIGYVWGRSTEHNRPWLLGLITALMAFVLLVVCLSLGG